MSDMNEYAKEGKKFVKAIDTYFSEFKETAGGDWLLFFWGRNPLPIEKWPNPTKIISGMNMFSYPENYRMPLIRCGCGGFDGFFRIGGCHGIFFDPHLKVKVSAMGAWQVSLLLVMATHVMPRVQHSIYRRWTPIFCDKDLQKLRKSQRPFSALDNATYEFLPKDLPTEPTVMPIKEGKVYQTTFYIWSDFGGYQKVVSTITFPSKHFFVVRDIEIDTEIESIVPYRAPVML